MLYITDKPLPVYTASYMIFRIVWWRNTVEYV